MNTDLTVNIEVDFPSRQQDKLRGGWEGGRGTYLEILLLL